MTRTTRFLTGHLGVLAAAVGSIWAGSSVQASTTLDLTTQPSYTETAAIGGTFIVRDTFIQPAGTGTFDTFLQLNPPGSESYERAYNASSPKVLDSGNSANFNKPIQLSEVPIVIFDGVLYYEFTLDANQVGNGTISLTQVQIFQSAAPVGNLVTDYSLTDATANTNAVISFPSIPAGPVFQLSTLSTAASDSYNIVVDSGKGSGTADMFLYVAVSNFAPIPTSYITLFAAFGTPPAGGTDANDGFEEWKLRQGVAPPDPNIVPEPSTIAMAFSAFGLMGLVGLRRLRRRPHVTSA